VKVKHCAARFSIILIALALIACVLGCSAERVVQYSIRISAAIGGTVTTPGQGLFYYPRGTVVNLVATPEVGYHFLTWTGNVDTIANVAAAVTTITINNNYYIVASFVR
jgi:Divergent InlB B-repeat domain